MNQHTDVNFLLGSWGPQPVDRIEAPPEATAQQLLIQADWHDLAVRWADWAVEEMAAGHAEMAAERARGAYRFCREFQLSGGKPWESSAACTECGFDLDGWRVRMCPQCFADVPEGGRPDAE